MPAEAPTTCARAAKLRAADGRRPRADAARARPRAVDDDLRARATLMQVRVVRARRTADRPWRSPAIVVARPADRARRSLRPAALDRELSRASVAEAVRAWVWRTTYGFTSGPFDRVRRASSPRLAADRLPAARSRRSRRRRRVARRTPADSRSTRRASARTTSSWGDALGSRRDARVAVAHERRTPVRGRGERRSATP